MLTVWFFCRSSLGSLLGLDLTGRWAGGWPQSWGEWLWLVPGPLHVFCCSSVIYIKCPNIVLSMFCEWKLLGLSSEVNATFTTFYWAKESHRAIPGTRNGANQLDLLMGGGACVYRNERNDLQPFFSRKSTTECIQWLSVNPLVRDVGGGQQRKRISEVIDEWTR